MKHVILSCIITLFKLCGFFFFFFRDKHQIIIGDENHLMLTINARNEGEGAYEAELFVMIPEEADYVGIERNSKVRLESTYTLSLINKA